MERFLFTSEAFFLRIVEGFLDFIVGPLIILTCQLFFRSVLVKTRGFVFQLLSFPADLRERRFINLHGCKHFKRHLPLFLSAGVCYRPTYSARQLIIFLFLLVVAFHVSVIMRLILFCLTEIYQGTINFVLF